MTWGGIDTWKEEMRSRVAYFLDLGFAMLLVDMPGIGQSPVLAGRDAERQWTPIFDWLERQDDLDGTPRRDARRLLRRVLGDEARVHAPGPPPLPPSTGAAVSTSRSRPSGRRSRATRRAT